MFLLRACACKEKHGFQVDFMVERKFSTSQRIHRLLPLQNFSTAVSHFYSGGSHGLQKTVLLKNEMREANRNAGVVP